MLHAADEMSAIRQSEKGRRLPVDGLLDIFMKGCAAENREEHLMTAFMLRQLDLEPCEDTLVGNDWFRGVSGGQRKRVSAGARCRRAACQGPEGTMRPSSSLCKAVLQQGKAHSGDLAPLQCLSGHRMCLLEWLPRCGLVQDQAGV